MTKRMRALILSMATVLLSVTLIVGASFALFSDSVTVNNHLAAGSLKVGLFRISYSEHVLGDGGLMTDHTDSEKVDLTADESKLFNVEKAVPTSYYSATLEVSNLGDVAFDYGVRILWDTDSASDEEKLFARQITITVRDADGTAVKEFALADCASNEISLGFLESAATRKFTVQAEFEDREDNDAVQLITIDFDLQLYATQKV